jgi:C-terminal processing protease CtpA/Prc
VYRICLLVTCLAAAFGLVSPPAGAQAEGVAPPAPLTDRGVENLEAFTRLLGLVRFYHPSDQAAAADWDRVAMIGVQEVEAASNAAALAEALERVFRPSAPTVRVFATGGEEPAVPSAVAAPPDDGSGTLAWRHLGIQFSEQNAYRSSREAPAAADGEPAPTPAESIVRRDLPGGVTAWVPRVLYTTGDGEGATVPAPLAGSALPASTQPEGFEPTGDDRTTRLAAVALAWPVFQHFYPYFDEVDVDWEAVLPATLRRAATDEDAEAFADTLRWMIARLDDGHGGVRMDGGTEFRSLPLSWRWIEDRLVIVHVEDDAPEGLELGDVVVEIDGEPTVQVLERREELTSSATDAARRGRVVETLRREGDRDLDLAVEGADGERREIHVPRRAPGPFALPRTEPRPEPVAEIEPGILYIDVTRLEDEEQQTAAIARLADARAAIIDVRGYPAISPRALPTFATEPITSARWNIPRLPLPDQEGVTYQTTSWPPAPPAEPHFGGPVAFLVDERAISYAESYLGIVEHYRLGEIVGTPTAGTNGNVNPFTLPGGYRVWWTGMKVTKHDGSRHHGVGIRPTVPAERTVGGVRAGRDEVLERGLEVVRAKLVG